MDAAVAHDAWHGKLPQGGSWQDDGHGAVDLFQRLTTYGNWAGPGNRLGTPGEQTRVAGQPAGYDPYRDPRYASVDGIDEAARVHDFSYGKLGEASAFGWDGMRLVRDDDRRLVADVGREMGQHGGEYSQSARNYANGLRGFFGGRAAGLDVADWGAARAGDVASGVGGFVEGAKQWGSIGDAVSGIGTGVSNAGRWLWNTGGDVVGGLARGAQAAGDLGVVGSISAAAGMGNAAIAGTGEALSRLYQWITD